MRWANDTIEIQTPTPSDTYGSVKIAWTKSKEIKVDAQPISKEKAGRDWGLNDSNEYWQLFIPTNDGLVEGYQIKFNNKQYLVRVFHGWQKEGASNHGFAVVSRVI